MRTWREWVGQIVPQRVREWLDARFPEKTSTPALRLPRPANFDRWGYGTLYSPDAVIQAFTLDIETRQALFRIIEAAQGTKLSPHDRLRSSREIVRGTWSKLHSMSLWQYGVRLDRKTGWYEDQDSRYWEELTREEFDLIGDSLRHGGLTALWRAQMALWEACRGDEEIVKLERSIGEFLVRWRRLSRILQVDDLPAAEPERINRLIEKSRSMRRVG